MTETNSNDAQSFLTIDQVADMHQVSRRTVERWISRGDLRASKLPGGLVRIARADAAAMLEPVAAPIDSAAGSRGDAGDPLRVEAGSAPSGDVSVPVTAGGHSSAA